MFQGNLDFGLHADAITVRGVRDAGPIIFLDSFSITGSGAAAFDIPDFEPVPLSADGNSYDVLVDVNLPPGLYAASVSFEASRGPRGRGRSSFGLRAEILRPGDCNADGKLDADDLRCVFDLEQRDVVLAALNTIPGDLDGDGAVAFEDFFTLSKNFGLAPASYAEGNIDLIDGVAFADFLILSNNFGKTPGDVAAVPEPNGCVLVWFGLLGIVALRRRRGL
jgi:hypothetical protein